MPILKKDFQIEDKNLYIFRQKDILVKKDDHTILPDVQIYNYLKDKDALYISYCDTNTNTVAADIGNHFEKDLEKAGVTDYELIPLRQYFYEAGDEAASKSSRCASYINWMNATKYCCTCGGELEPHDVENALYCKNCKALHFPRIEPCIIVLIHKEDKVLMLRHTYRNQDRFVCLAGFMEVGETVEQCVEREVKEEVGLEITNIRYMGSQGWPFPDQLMLAFYADYKSGEIKLQESEIAEARWLNPKELTNPPNPGTVAWRLINNKF